jgi:hypothetical protein
MQNITSFVVACFINKISLGMTTIFAQNFWIRRVIKFGSKKSQTNYNLEWREYNRNILWSLESWLGQASKQEQLLTLSTAGGSQQGSEDGRSAELDRFRWSLRRRGSEEYVAPCMQLRRRRPPHAGVWWLVQVHCTNAGDLSPCSSNPSHCKRRFICPSRLKYSNYCGYFNSLPHCPLLRSNSSG